MNEFIGIDLGCWKLKEIMYQDLIKKLDIINSPDSARANVLLVRSIILTEQM